MLCVYLIRSYNERYCDRKLTCEVLAGLVPCAVLLLGLFLIPESPRWLVRIVMKQIHIFDIRAYKYICKYTHTCE